MTFQIKSIILYSSNGETRALDFQVGKVNIITGKSNTGKSTILNIVEYCLGHSTFNIPEGIIRDTVAWYAVLYQFEKTQIFIAKPAPAATYASQSNVYLEFGTDVSIPPLARLVPNSTDTAVVQYISRLLDISPNLNVPEEGQSRKALEANLNHTRFYLFQDQGIVANKSLLFHQQSEQWIPQTIKDTLPYFLGILQENNLQLIQQLREARRDLGMAQRKLTEAESIVNDSLFRGQSLVAEAQQVGLINGSVAPKDAEEVIHLLNESLSWRPSISPAISDDRLLQLQEKQNQVREEFHHKHEQIKAAETFEQEANGYSLEAREQEMRLVSVNIFSTHADDSDVCPLCSSKTSRSFPKIAAIKENLTRLQSNLESVKRERPRLREYIMSLQQEREDLRQQLEQLELDIVAVQEEYEASQKIRDANSRIARVVGRISLYLETLNLTDENSKLRLEVEQAKQRLNDLEKQLDSSETEDIKTSVLNILGLQMTEWANKLELEFHGNPYRLDINRLTVIADRGGRPISMSQSMGGGENWLGCHLIALLALHKYFIEQKRPVPGFLFLDQPTQVYFPPEKYKSMEGDIAEITDEDREAVSRVFEFLFDVCEQLFPNLQIIVTDHANLNTTRFQDALIEDPWRGGRALIPAHWSPQ